MSRAAIITEKPCAQCGEPFTRDPRNTRAYFSRAKYCSQKCAGLANSAHRASIRPSMQDAFDKWVEKSESCWEWRGARDRDGYGLFSYARKSYRAPVVALRLSGTEVAKGFYACHHCDNPACVRPDHLYAGTPKENSADAAKRGRTRPGKRAKLSPSDVVAIRQSTGTHGEIAARYNVSRAAVSMIIERKTWRNIP